VKVARVLRIIEYVGPEAWVEQNCIAQRKIKGRKVFPNGGYITEGILGNTAELLECSALQEAAEALVNQKLCPDCGGGQKFDSTLCRTCGGRAYVSAIVDFDETAEELRREADKATTPPREDHRLGAEEREDPDDLCACGHYRSQHRQLEYQCGGVGPDWQCPAACPHFVAS